MAAPPPRLSPPPFRVRHAVPADAPALAEIYNAAIRERIATFETEERTEAAMRAWLEAHDASHPVLVYESSPAGSDVADQVLAWASIASYRARACYAGIGEFSIYVREGHRGQGVGTHLLLALVTEAERLGYWKLLSRIFPHNRASRRLVTRCGFREVGVYEKHGKLDGRWLDTVIVERLLPANLR